MVHLNLLFPLCALSSVQCKYYLPIDSWGLPLGILTFFIHASCGDILELAVGMLTD